MLDQLGAAVNATTQVDFTNPGFLRQYAIVFGASSFLVLILWVLAVVKRAAHGLPLGQAVSEAIGFLWMSVMASAFLPLALALVVQLTDDICSALIGGTSKQTGHFLGGVGQLLTTADIGGGPIMLVFVSLFALAAAAIIWLELLLRAAMLYVGGVLGCAVLSGLVDRSLWRHVRRWVGLMVAIDLSKVVLVVVLGLAAALAPTASAADAFSSVLSGLAVLFVSIFASLLIYRFVPTFGDDMAQLHASRRTAQNAGPGGRLQRPRDATSGRAWPLTDTAAVRPRPRRLEPRAAVPAGRPRPVRPGRRSSRPESPLTPGSRPSTPPRRTPAGVTDRPSTPPTQRREPPSAPPSRNGKDPDDDRAADHAPELPDRQAQAPGHHRPQPRAGRDPVPDRRPAVSACSAGCSCPACRCESRALSGSRSPGSSPCSSPGAGGRSTGGSRSTVPTGGCCAPAPRSGGPTPWRPGPGSTASRSTSPRRPGSAGSIGSPANSVAEPLGVLLHIDRRSVTATLEIEGPGVGSRDSEDQEALVQRFGQVLQHVANTDGFVTRLSIMARTLPADPYAHAKDVARRGDPRRPGLAARVVRRAGLHGVDVERAAPGLPHGVHALHPRAGRGGGLAAR